MLPVRVALAQVNPSLGDLRKNLDLALATARSAARAGARIVVFPELALSGYVLRDMVPEVALTTDGPVFGRLLAASRAIDLVVGFVEEGAGHRFYNSAAYLSGGRIFHIHRKIYLPTYGLFQEGRDFAAGEQVRAFETAHGRAGILICEDCWHPTTAWLLAQQGAEILFVLANGPTRGARPGRGVTSVGVWHDLLKVTAQFETSFVVYVNRVGYEDGLNFGGGSEALDPFGRTIAALPPLEEAVGTAALDPEVLRRARTAYPLLRDDDLDLVSRELERIRRLRYDLPQPREDTSQGPAASAAGSAPAAPPNSGRRGAGP
jgi:predicted amidohydrolase